MTNRQKPRQEIRVLFSEGSSLTARQALSALGPLGYVVDVCDPDPLCLCRFSRFVRAFYRCPPLGADPLGYLRFVEERLRAGDYDVLLPVHEQAYLFAWVRDRLQARVGLAVSDFASFDALLGKASFVRLMDELGLPHPPTRLVRSRAELEEPRPFPYYLKTEYGTASSGVWRVSDERTRGDAIAALEAAGVLDGRSEVLVQDAAPGRLTMVQAAFDQGRLLAVHCCERRVEGTRGSSSAKVAVSRPAIRDHVTRLGEHLHWHGSLSLDCIVEPTSGQAYLIDANPRMAEPLSAALCGVNVPELVVRLALGEHPAPVEPKSTGVRTHMLLAALLRIGELGGSRRELLREVWQAVRRRGAYAESEEELLRLREDPPSLVPLVVVLAQLIVSPTWGKHNAQKAVASYALTPAAIRTIREGASGPGE